MNLSNIKKVGFIKDFNRHKSYPEFFKSVKPVKEVVTTVEDASKAIAERLINASMLSKGSKVSKVSDEAKAVKAAKKAFKAAGNHLKETTSIKSW